MKRFYKRVAVVKSSEGSYIELDGRLVKTPKKTKFTIKSERLAEAIGEEWRLQGEMIKPETMPLLRLANTAIDVVGGQRDAVVDNLAGFGQTDLLCYRAIEPEELVLRQEKLWSPWLKWAASFHGAELCITCGITYIEQNKLALAALRHAVDAYDIMELAGLNDLVTISGSLVIGLAVKAGAIDIEEAWSVARVDNEFQADRWGRDAEAEMAAQRLQGEFRQAGRFLALHCDG